MRQEQMTREFVLWWRYFFAGILCVFQEKVTKSGRKLSVRCRRRIVRCCLNFPYWLWHCVRHYYTHELKEEQHGGTAMLKIGDFSKLSRCSVRTINWQGHTRFWRAEKRSCCLNALANTQSIACGLFIAWTLFCSGKTACTWQLWIFVWFLVFETKMCRNPSRRKGQKAPKRHAVRRVCSCQLMVSLSEI